MRIHRAESTQFRGTRQKFVRDLALELPKTPLYAVCDGVGGAESAKAVVAVLKSRADVIADHGHRVQADPTTATRIAIGQYFVDVFNEAGRSVRQEQLRLGNPRLAASLVVTTILDRFAYVAHVGDARAYLYRNGELRCLTSDHTLATLQLRRGEITPEDYLTSPFRHTLTQALGVTPVLDVDIAEVRVADRDILLLTSNGLARIVPEEGLAELMADRDTHEICEALNERARDADAPDDVTAIAVEIASPERTQPSAMNIDLLLNAVLIRDLEETQWLTLAPYLEELVFEDGAVVFREGEAYDNLYIIARGDVRLSQRGHEVGWIQPGGHLGLLNLAVDNPTEHTSTAAGEVHAFALSRDRLAQLARSKSYVGSQLHSSLLTALGRELADVRRRLAAAGIYSGGRPS